MKQVINSPEFLQSVLRYWQLNREVRFVLW